jgi:hypothetical protein
VVKSLRPPSRYPRTTHGSARRPTYRHNIYRSTSFFALP